MPDLSQLSVPLTESEIKQQQQQKKGRSQTQPSTGVESTSVAPRQRPKGAAPPATSGLGLPIQTTIAPRKRPTASTSNPPTPVVSQPETSGSALPQSLSAQQLHSLAAGPASSSAASEPVSAPLIQLQSPTTTPLHPLAAVCTQVYYAQPQLQQLPSQLQQPLSQLQQPPSQLQQLPQQRMWLPFAAAAQQQQQRLPFTTPAAPATTQPITSFQGFRPPCNNATQDGIFKVPAVPKVG